MHGWLEPPHMPGASYRLNFGTTAQPVQLKLSGASNQPRPVRSAAVAAAERRATDERDSAQAARAEARRAGWKSHTAGQLAQLRATLAERDADLQTATQTAAQLENSLRVERESAAAQRTAMHRRQQISTQTAQAAIRWQMEKREKAEELVVRPLCMSAGQALLVPSASCRGWCPH